MYKVLNGSDILLESSSEIETITFVEEAVNSGQDTSNFFVEQDGNLLPIYVKYFPVASVSLGRDEWL